MAPVFVAEPVYEVLADSGHLSGEREYHIVSLCRFYTKKYGKLVTVVMLKKIQKIIKLPVIFGLLLFIVFAVSQFGMGMEMNGKMVNCPFTGHSMSICKMNPLEHIEEWQSMFTAIPAKDVISVFFLLLVIVALTTLSFWNRFSIPDIRYLHKRLLYKKKFHIPNPLEEAFSQGILNPKLF